MTIHHDPHNQNNQPAAANASIAAQILIKHLNWHYQYFISVFVHPQMPSVIIITTTNNNHHHCAGHQHRNRICLRSG